MHVQKCSYCALKNYGTSNWQLTGWAVTCLYSFIFVRPALFWRTKRQNILLCIYIIIFRVSYCVHNRDGCVLYWNTYKYIRFPDEQKRYREFTYLSSLGTNRGGLFCRVSLSPMSFSISSTYRVQFSSSPSFAISSNPSCFLAASMILTNDREEGQYRQYGGKIGTPFFYKLIKYVFSWPLLYCVYTGQNSTRHGTSAVLLNNIARG